MRVSCTRGTGAEGASRTLDALGGTGVTVSLVLLPALVLSVEVDVALAPTIFGASLSAEANLECEGEATADTRRAALTVAVLTAIVSLEAVALTLAMNAAGPLGARCLSHSC